MTLQRKTPLQRKSGLKSSGTEMKRTPIKARSTKTEAVYRKRRELVQRMLDNSAGDNWCQVILLIQQIDPDHRCGLYLMDVHEPKLRSRGGDILDEEANVATCRPCHDWIHQHPEDAERLGLMKASYE